MLPTKQDSLGTYARAGVLQSSVLKGTVNSSFVGWRIEVKEDNEADSSSTSENGRELEEAKQLLEDVEAATLSGVALALTEATESLSRMAKDLAELRSGEWMTAEQAAKYLGCGSVKAFEKIAAREGIPKHYLSARAPRYNRAELDAWLLSRRGAAHR